MELAHRLDHETNSRWLVGFTRSPKGGANDPLLRVVSDLYQRWLADTRAWEQVKTVSGNQDGFGYYQATQKNGWRWSTARAFLDPARRRSNLRIETDASCDTHLI